MPDDVLLSRDGFCRVIIYVMSNMRHIYVKLQMHTIFFGCNTQTSASTTKSESNVS
jgi:hypothetical protein